MSDSDPRDEFRRRQRTNLIAMIIVAVLVVGSVGLLAMLHQGIKRETCFAANHRSCAPIDENQ
jgi:hypothetical protein